MKTIRPILICGVLTAGVIVMSAPAFAVPPTVDVNPGYDRRLKESRQPRNSYSAPAPRHHTHKTHKRHWHW